MKAKTSHHVIYIRMKFCHHRRRRRSCWTFWRFNVGVGALWCKLTICLFVSSPNTFRWQVFLERVQCRQESVRIGRSSMTNVELLGLYRSSLELISIAVLTVNTHDSLRFRIAPSTTLGIEAIAIPAYGTRRLSLEHYWVHCPEPTDWQIVFLHTSNKKNFAKKRFVKENSSDKRYSYHNEHTPLQRVLDSSLYTLPPTPAYRQWSPLHGCGYVAPYAARQEATSDYIIVLTARPIDRQLICHISSAGNNC